jgi:hypothetical protein
MATATQRNTLVGVFETPETAHQGVEALHRAGFSDRQITMVHHAKALDGIEVTDLDAAKAAQVSGESKEKSGVVIGVIVGAIVGALLAIGVMSLPEFAPNIWAHNMFGTDAVWGIIACLALGVLGGAIGGAIVGAFIGLEFPNREAIVYERELKAGHALVGVKAGKRAPEAWEILRACGAHGLA